MFNFNNISALSANALAVMQFINNSENNSNNYHNKINHTDKMTAQSTVDTHGSQQGNEHSNCYDYLSDLDDRNGEYSNEFKCMNKVQMNHRINDVAVSSSKNYLVRKGLHNNNFLRRIINKTANNQCDAHAKSKDFSIDFLLNLNKI